MSQKDNNHQSKIQSNSQISSQVSGKDKESFTVEELKMQLEAERREKEAERQRAEKAETEKAHLQKRLKKIFKRGLSIEDLGLKGIFFGFLKVLRIKTHQLISVNFSHFRSWLWFGLKKGRILAYLTTFLLILAIFIPSAFLVGQLSKLITQYQTQNQQTQQQTQQHFSTGELNLADQRINPSVTLATSSAHAHAHQTKEDFEGSEMNIAKGFGYTTTATNLLQPLGTAPNISDTAFYRSPRFDLGVKTKPTEMIVSRTAPSNTDLKVYVRSGNSLTLDTDNISENILRDTTRADFEVGLEKTNISITPTANEISSLMSTITDTSSADFENGVANQVETSNDEAKLEAFYGEETLNQAYTTANNSLGWQGLNFAIARYFRPTISGRLSKIELYLYRNMNYWCPIRVEIRFGGASVPSAEILASLDYNLTQTTETWISFNFPIPPILVKDQHYWIVLKPASAQAYPYWKSHFNQYHWPNNTAYSADSGNTWSNAQHHVATYKVYLEPMAYPSSGSLVRTIDFGQKVNINDISWTESIQAGVTDVTFDIQTSSDGINWDTPITGLTDPSGGSINRYNRYLKYTMNLSTTDSSKTPIVFDVSVSVGGLNGTYESSIIDLNSTSPIDLLAIQADLPTTETQISIAVRAGSPATSTCTSGVNWQTDWDSSPVFNLNSNPSGANPKILTHQPSITQPYRCWQYRIIGKTNGNATWIVRDVFLVPQPEGYGKLKLVADKGNTYPTNIQQAGDNQYFQYLILGASNGSAAWNLDKVELTSKFSSFNLGKRYQIARVSLTDNDDLLYRIHYSLENTDNYISVTAWQDTGDKTASHTLSHTFPANKGQALKWIRFNRVSSVGSPPTSPTAIAFLAKEANVYVIKKKTNGTFEELPRSEAGTTRAYYGITLPAAAIGKTSETQTYQICAGPKGDLRYLTIKALPHPEEESQGYKCASLAWEDSTDETKWIDAAEGPGGRAAITPLISGYGDQHQIISSNTCKFFYLRTRVPLEGVTEGPKKIRFYFEGEVL